MNVRIPSVNEQMSDELAVLNAMERSAISLLPASEVAVSNRGPSGAEEIDHLSLQLFVSAGESATRHSHFSLREDVPGINPCVDAMDGHSFGRAFNPAPKVRVCAPVPWQVGNMEIHSSTEELAEDRFPEDMPISVTNDQVGVGIGYPIHSLNNVRLSSYELDERGDRPEIKNSHIEAPA